MTLSDAWLGLLSIIVVVNLALTFGLLRALRHRQYLEPAARIARPIPGTAIEFSDAWKWSDGTIAPPRGNALVAFVVPGCLGCQVLRREFETLSLPTATPLLVAADAEASGFDVADYLATSWSIADAVAVAPEPLEAMSSVGGPNELPAIALIRDGVVVASAHRLEHLMEMLQPADWVSPAARPATS